MSSNERYVFDTNVIISALLFQASVPGEAFRQAFGRGTILISQWLVEELSDVLERDKFNRYVKRAERERFLEALIDEAELAEITESVRVSRDPKDDPILELAVSGGATMIVTGDDDLIVLKSYRGIPIVTPARLLELHAEPPLES